MAGKRRWTRKKNRGINNENVDPSAVQQTEHSERTTEEQSKEMTLSPSKGNGGRRRTNKRDRTFAKSGNAPDCSSETDSPLKKKPFVKRCFVPKCGATEKNSCGKLFFCVTSVQASKEKIRQRMTMALGKEFQFVTYKCTLYICSDHFDHDSDFEEDCSLLGIDAPVLKLKKNVLPHLLLRSCVNGCIIWKEYNANEPFCHTPYFKLKRSLAIEVDDDWDEHLVSKETEEAVLKEVQNRRVQARKLFEEELESISNQSDGHSCGVAALEESFLVTDEEADWNGDDQDDSDFVPDSSELDSTVDSQCSGLCRSQMKELSTKLMLHHSSVFLGVSKQNLSIISSLAKRVDGKDTDLARFKVMVVLRKVRLNESYNLLSIYLGLCAKTISKYFRETVATVSACLAQLIFRPDREVIVSNLPQSFRYRYFLTDEIIDAFEFEIEKPTRSALKQSATYSAYKGFNGLKVVLGVTPDGYISYISKCFGGRVSDVEICKRTGYLTSLKKNMVIMADRGFKHMSNQLLIKGCKLVRPPSVSANAPLGEAECLQAKQIASLRIHVERVISRIRKFAMVSPHSCLSPNLIEVADFAVTIAAGLVNLGSAHIKV